MKDVAFENWLAGFIDGEGCFRFTETQNGNLYPRFCIMLRADDIDILYKIQAYLGGTVKPRKTYNGSAPGALFQLDTHKDLVRLVEILDRAPLRAKKAKDYALWRKAVIGREAFSAKRLTSHQRTALNSDISALREKLAVLRGYQGATA